MQAALRQQLASELVEECPHLHMLHRDAYGPEMRVLQNGKPTGVTKWQTHCCY
jgi:hypothetical protein